MREAPTPAPPDARALLAQALEAEAQKQWAHSHVLCERALALAPEEPDALNLLGRLCAVAGDTARAIALQSFVVHLVPEHTRAAADLAVLRPAGGARARAHRSYAAALRVEPDVACHRRYFVSLAPFAGMERAERLLRESIGIDPSHARAHAALGNVLARRMDCLAAIASYGLAAMLCWDDPDIHLMLADLLDWAGETAMARRHRTVALARRQLFRACPVSAGAQRSVLVLAAAGGAVENAPLDLLLDPARTALHRWYLVEGAAKPRALPAYDAIFNAFEELEASAQAIERAAAFAARAGVRSINDPRKLAGIARSRLPATLAGVPDCSVPPAVRLVRAQLDGLDDRARELGGIAFPLVIRPVDSQRGEGLERLATAGEVSEYAARNGAAAYHVSPFVDYRSADGYYRKYRAIVVDGESFAYHLAVSDRWMVHYTGSLMRDRAWMRDEEAAFLARPDAVFPHWNAIFADVARAVGLDYFGVDFARRDDGTILIFECGAAMLVHCREDAALFPYKYRFVPRIFEALERMLDRRIGKRLAPETER